MAITYPFFFSYASGDEENSKKNQTDEHGRVWDLYYHVNRTVKIALGSNTNGSFAPLKIRAGEVWTEDLPRALNSSPVLVCLWSSFYFKSEACGRELEVFLRRRKLYRQRSGGASPPPCIIPLLWFQFADQLPLAIPDFQLLRASGAKEGEFYNAFVNGTSSVEEDALTVAKLILDLIKNNKDGRELPAFPTLPDWTTIPSAFQNPNWPLPDLYDEKGMGPVSVTFVYPAGADPNSLPFAPPPPNAVVRAAAMAKRREWIFQGVGFQTPDDDWETKIKWAQLNRSRVVLMLTETILGDRELMERFAKIPGGGIATAVLSTSTTGRFPPEFPMHHRPNAFFATREKFDDLLFEKLERLRAAIEAEPTSDKPGPTPWG